MKLELHEIETPIGTAYVFTKIPGGGYWIWKDSTWYYYVPNKIIIRADGTIIWPKRIEIPPAPAAKVPTKPEVAPPEVIPKVTPKVRDYTPYVMIIVGTALGILSGCLHDKE